MYVRACCARWGPRAQKVVKDEIKRLDAANDKSGVRMWSLVAEQLPRVRTERTKDRVFE
jgi:ribosomal protein L18E